VSWGGKRYLRVTSLAEARELLVGGLVPGWGQEEEEIPVTGALDRILHRAVTARFSAPAHHAAAMDGYALAASRSVGAREDLPVRLALGTEAVPVDTGDALPPGTNAVLMAEDAHHEEGAILVRRSLSPWEHVRMMGEDVVAGEILLPAGTLLSPYDLGLLLAGGVIAVAVRRRPVVGIIPTGDELVAPGIPPGPGQVTEFNSAVLAGLVRRRGGEALILPAIPDRPGELAAGVAEAVSRVDILAINAGSSAGRDDHTARILQEQGRLLVHGVGITPGKPTVLGFVGETPVVGLPGYPASAMVSCDLFLLPLVDRFLGRDPPDPCFLATASRDLPSRPGHDEFIRGQAARVGPREVFNPLPRGASLISSFARANAVAHLPASCEGVERGTEVRVRPLVSQGERTRSVLLAGSNDLCLDVLREELLRSPSQDLLISTQGSLGGLVLLADGYAHLATCHLLDPASGTYNLPYLRRFLPGREVATLLVAHRDQGLLVAPGNPLGIAGVGDLGREGVTFVNRQRGSGTRILLDHLLASENMTGEAIRGYAREEISHLTVAAAVAGGLADAGLGIRSAALALGLDFVPLAREPFQLVYLPDLLPQGLADRLRSILRSEGFRRRLEALGGYHTGESGADG
jgi:putative molybdopterin biosynthesis protein